MKKIMVMFMAVCTMFICGMTVNAADVNTPAQTVVQTEDSAGIHGNIIDAVKGDKCSCPCCKKGCDCCKDGKCTCGSKCSCPCI